LQAFPLVRQFASNHVVTHLTVLSGFVLQVAEHLLGAQVVTGHLLRVHVLLANRQNLVLHHLDVLSELALLFVQAGVLLLLLAQLGSGFKQLLEVSLVALVLEQVDLRQQLLLLLL